MDLIWGVRQMLQLSGLGSVEPKRTNDPESTFEGLGNRLTQTMSSYTNLLKEEGIPPPALAATSPCREPHNPKAMEERARIIDLCSQILAMAMDPEMHLFTSSLQFHFCACLKTAVDLRIHDHVPKKGTIMAGALGKAVGADEALLRRIMRILIAKSIFCEPKKGHYAHTPASLVITQRGMSDLLGHRLDESFRSASRLPDALASQGYREPTMGNDFGFQLAFGTRKNYWEYIRDDPKYGGRFARAMRAVTVNMLEEIPALYPFDQLADHGGLIVDVGGGMGLVAQRILSYWSHAGLKCVVQDQSGVDASNGRDDIKTQLHDFFEPQPIKGAAAYLFRQIFHDWPDQACVTILKQTVEAMDPKQSRILIIDQVMAENNPSLAAVLYDIDMMALYGGKERTLSEWKTLLSAASPRLEITNVFRSSSSMTAVLEVRLRE